MDRSYNQVRDSSEAAFRVLTEKELAEHRRSEGARVIQHGGHYWSNGSSRVFEPVHLLARLTPEQATRPTPLSWAIAPR